MAVLEREVDIATGRRSVDGRVRVSVFAAGLLALAIEGKGERVPTLLLTVEQARKLQSVLAELISLAEGDDAEGYGDQPHHEPWDGQERRANGR